MEVEPVVTNTSLALLPAAPFCEASMSLSVLALIGATRNDGVVILDFDI